MTDSQSSKMAAAASMERERATDPDYPATPRDRFADAVYPERWFGGFTRCDGTLAFVQRVWAMLGLGDRVLDVGCGRGVAVEDPCAYRRRLQTFRGEQRHVVGIDTDAAGK